MAPGRKSRVFRVTGLHIGQLGDAIEALKTAIDGNLSEEERSTIKASLALAPSCYGDEQARVALVEFDGGVPQFLSDLIKNPLGEWQTDMGGTDIAFDCHFFGFTQLYVPVPGHPVTAE